MSIFSISLIFLLISCAANKPETGTRTYLSQYQKDYSECLQLARQGTQFVDEIVREQTLGLALNGCMAERGYEGFAAVDERQQWQMQHMKYMYSYF